MTVFIFQGGEIIERRNRRAVIIARSDLPAPMLSRMEPYESPVTEKQITSWRERDRDMAAAGAVDPRDMPPPSRGTAAAAKKGERDGRKHTDDNAGFEWRSPTGG